MRRLYRYPQIPNYFIELVRYGGLMSSVVVFWLGITFPSLVQIISNNLQNTFLSKPTQISYSNMTGPYSDALERNFVTNKKK